MNKANIQEKWGRYCDTSSLVDTMMMLFKKYKIRNSEHGVCKMLDAYFTNKQPLIDLFAKSPNYNGNMRIVLDIEMEREVNGNEVDVFCSSFMNKVKADSVILKMVDGENKTREDYLANLSCKLTPDEFSKKETKKLIESISSFAPNGATKESVENNEQLQAFFRCRFGDYRRTTVDRESALVRCAKDLPTPVTLPHGMKTSRAFNKVCNTYGIDLLPDYNKLFAKYADMVSDLKRKMKFFISVNPLDYLTMSFGVSWQSCHNLRSGGWRGGTVSYMLDSTSFITFVHNEIPTNCEEGKIYREMFHYSNGNLIQSRIYPSSNDGARDLYDFFGGLVCAELAKLEDKENLWTRRDTCSDDYIKGNQSAQYPDYGCHTTKAHYAFTDSADVAIPIGAQRICAYCGKPLTNYGCSYLAHSEGDIECELA